MKYIELNNDFIAPDDSDFYNLHLTLYLASVQPLALGVIAKIDDGLGDLAFLDDLTTTSLEGDYMTLAQTLANGFEEYTEGKSIIEPDIIGETLLEMLRNVERG